MLNQQKTPIKDALQALQQKNVIPFDVPGHKRGNGILALTEFLGEKCLSLDVNSMKPLDNLCHPVSIIKEAEELAADAFGAAWAFFMVNGTTSAVQAMIMATCKQGDKIILPRNVHSSVLNALVLCGAVPVYVECHVSQHFGIATGTALSDIEQAILENPTAKAILVNNPTYYGVCLDLAGIVKLAKAHNMQVLVDEAHGTHFYFGENLPIAAIAAGADMAAVSMHKSGGSLTQSSFLLCSKNVNVNYVRRVINLTQTTSASYILLASLDISRSHLAVHGKEIFANVLKLAEYARREINKIPGLHAFSDEIIDKDIDKNIGKNIGTRSKNFAEKSTVHDFDRTKLSINTLGIGLAGIEVYDILRDNYNIQIEFGDIGNILAYISIGDNIQNVHLLITALSEIQKKFSQPHINIMKQEYIPPIIKIAPQAAFYAEKQMLPIRQTVGKICADFIMCYPPGIPIAAPGEQITAEIVDYILYAKEKGCFLTGTEDITVENINVVV